MTVQTLQNSNQLDNVPTDVLAYIASKLTPEELLVFRAASMRFKTLLDHLGKEPHKIWERFFPHCLVLTACGQAAHSLSEAISNGNDANEVRLLALKDTKKIDRKIAKFLHVSNQLERNKDALTFADEACEDAKIPISKAAKKFEEAFKNCLRDMKLSPSGKMRPNDSVKLQRCFTFLFRWLQKLSGVENKGSPTQQAFIKEMVDVIYANTMRSIYSWMTDEFVNSKEPKTKEGYKFMRQCLGNKELEAGLHEKNLQNKGGFEGLDF
jgi:hypothetical protein